jgi:hypothetical protein
LSRNLTYNPDRIPLIGGGTITISPSSMFDT